ncbi:MAG: hypothetical protein NZM10_07365 [Fimbriimonadales bacterium]|nr:hypothetical protein [Fimbriimonadales bacterium]
MPNCAGELVRSVGVPPTMWLGRLAQAKSGLDSRVQAAAQTGLSVLQMHGLEARATQGIGAVPTHENWLARSSSL